VSQNAPSRGLRGCCVRNTCHKPPTVCRTGSWFTRLKWATKRRERLKGAVVDHDQSFTMTAVCRRHSSIPAPSYCLSPSCPPRQWSLPAAQPSPPPPARSYSFLKSIFRITCQGPGLAPHRFSAPQGASNGLRRPNQRPFLTDREYRRVGIRRYIQGWSEMREELVPRDHHQIVHILTLFSLLELFCAAATAAFMISVPISHGSCWFSRRCTGVGWCFWSGQACLSSQSCRDRGWRRSRLVGRLHHIGVSTSFEAVHGKCACRRPLPSSHQWPC